MLFGVKSRAADAMDRLLADYPVLNLKKKKRPLRYRSDGKGVVAKGYLRQTFSDGRYRMDIPTEFRWEPNRVTLLLDLCPRDFARSMSLPRTILSAGARIAYNVKARNTQILDGSPDNGYAGRGFLLEGSLRCDSRQVGAALGELLEEVTVRRREELSDFCVLTLG